MSFHKRLFSTFKLKKNESLSDILRSTKKMVENGKSFKCYLEHYNSLIQIASFKIPFQTTYPKLRVTSIIPINKNTFYYDKINQRNKSMIDMSKDNKISKPYRKIPIINNIRSKLNIRKKKKLEINKIIYNSNSEILLTRSFLNFKGRHWLLEELLYKWKDFPELNFDESEIFNRNEFYTKFIEKNIRYIQNNTIENSTTFLETTFYDTSKNEIYLKLSSMKIRFIPQSENYDENNKETVLILPFAYLILFYFKEIEFFKYILLACIKFNDDYTKITLDEKEIYSFVRNEENDDLLAFKKENVNQSKKNDAVNSNNENEERPMLLSCKSKSPKHLRGQISINKSIGQFPKLSIIKNNNTTNKQKKTIKYNCKTNCKQFINNIYEFFWLTPVKEYKVEISVPMILFKFPCENKIAIKYIDRELFLFLHNKNFQNWDFYIMNYLFSFKQFRHFIGSIYKKYKKDYLNYQDTQMDQRVFELSKESTKTSYGDSLSFPFFYTGEDKINSILTFHSYTLKIDDSKLNPKVNWEFNFNFNQMKFLNSVRKYEKLESFIEKIIIKDTLTRSIKLNYSIFEDFDIKTLKDTKTFIQEREKEREREIEKNYENMVCLIRNGYNNYSRKNLILSESCIDYVKEEIILQNSFELEIKFPYLSLERYNEFNTISRNLNKVLSNEFIEKMEKLNFAEWPNFIIKNIGEWNFKNRIQTRRMGHNNNTIILKQISKGEMNRAHKKIHEHKMSFSFNKINFKFFNGKNSPFNHK